MARRTGLLSSSWKSPKLLQSGRKMTAAYDVGCRPIGSVSSCKFLRCENCFLRLKNCSPSKHSVRLALPGRPAAKRENKDAHHGSSHLDHVLLDSKGSVLGLAFDPRGGRWGRSLGGCSPPAALCLRTW